MPPHKAGCGQSRPSVDRCCPPGTGRVQILTVRSWQTAAAISDEAALTVEAVRRTGGRDTEARVLPTWYTQQQQQ